MNKLLKLTGVSVLTIVAATGANAAGYTCEELIEYTSCNDGYYLNSGKCIEGATCGAGNYLQPTCDSWDFANDWCFIEGALRTGWTQDSCEESGGEWYGVGCGNYDFVEFEAAEWVCTPCAAGTYQNVAGQDSCIICPAGSECATVGLATHTLCEIGEYSGAGATACSTCPTHMYTNANGQSVTVSATSNAGAGSPTACYIDPDTYFTDVTGTYHFKQECTYSVGFYVPSDGESCMDGYIARNRGGM